MGFRPWRASRPKLPARGRGAPGRWPRGLDAPAGLLATAARDRSPRPPGLRRLRRGARLHRILIAPGPCRPPRSRQTRRLFALGHRGWPSARAGFVCLGASYLVVSPSGWASAGPDLEGHSQRRKSIPSRPTFTRGGWSQAERALGAWTAGFGPHCSAHASVSPSEGGHSGWGIAGPSSLLALLPLPLPAFASSARRAAGPGRIPKGENAARPSWRRSQEELETRMSPMPQAQTRPPGRDRPHPLEVRRKLGVCPEVCIWGHRRSAGQEAAAPPGGWGGARRARRDPGTPRTQLRRPRQSGTAGRGLPGRNETRIWRRAPEGPSRHPHREAAAPGS